jgi:hypothetical protein
MTTRPFVPLAYLAAAILAVPAIAHAGGGNNLNMLPPPGVKFGIARISGKTLTVKLERSTPKISPPLNDSYLRITDVPADADVRPPVNGTTFAAAYPNGAWELADLGEKGFGFRELFASKGCLQVAGESGGWDNARVYCDKTKVTRIKISSATGTDLVAVSAAITVPVTHKCGRREACGLGCIEAPTVCCATPGFEGCVTPPGTCDGFDPNDQSTFPMCPVAF